MSKYYFMAGADMRSAACAVGPQDGLFLYQSYKEIREYGKLPFDLTLKRIVYRNGKKYEYDDCSKLKTIWCDCQKNSLLLFLCSEKLRNVINDHLKGCEGVEWASCKITYQEEKRNYYFPIFTKELDVMDKDNRFLDEEKAKAYTMFTIRTRFNWQVPSSIYISQELKRAIYKECLQRGIYFNEAGVIF